MGKSLLYLCFHDNKLVGLLSIRYELPKDLSDKYGDIGYGVRPSERNKGYATKMLQHALSVCTDTDSEFGHHYALKKSGVIPAKDKEEVFIRLKEWLNR